MKMRKVGNLPVAQGEVVIRRIDKLPNGPDLKPVERTARGFIISHSEQGHHHLLTGGDVMERGSNAQGLQIFYAILKKPAQFIQDAANPHGGYDLDPGIYEFKVSREYDPFAEQARRVAD